MQVYVGKLNPKTGRYKVGVENKVLSPEIRKAMGALVMEKKQEQEEVISF